MAAFERSNDLFAWWRANQAANDPFIAQAAWLAVDRCRELTIPTARGEKQVAERAFGEGIPDRAVRTAAWADLAGRCRGFSSLTPEELKSERAALEQRMASLNSPMAQLRKVDELAAAGRILEARSKIEAVIASGDPVALAAVGFSLPPNLGAVAQLPVSYLQLACLNGADCAKGSFMSNVACIDLGLCGDNLLSAVDEMAAREKLSETLSSEVNVLASAIRGGDLSKLWKDGKAKSAVATGTVVSQ
ncbi:hypothetical protein GCM10025771_26410 [Niveibacterium umoris]|uniref:hypothetical protein n=1 Tax=Niveibacterium umoris TaxID=1193620 RepID=UPI00160E661C|nr:hypothetical protein [Niveibacterium umoris]